MYSENRQLDEYNYHSMRVNACTIRCGLSCCIVIGVWRYLRIATGLAYIFFLWYGYKKDIEMKSKNMKVTRVMYSITRCLFFVSAMLVSSCHDEPKTITEEEFYQYAKEHRYIINGGDTTINSKVWGILKDKKLLKPDIEAQFKRHDIDSTSYYGLCRIITAAYPNTSTEDIVLMAKMVYLHGPNSLVDPTTANSNPKVPFFLSTDLGSPMEVTMSLLQTEFDPYMDGWIQAKEHNIPYYKLYFSKLGEGVFELVVPYE